MKEKYVEPGMDIISMRSIQETMQVSSPTLHMGGDNLGNPVDSGDWTDLFDDLG